MSTDGLDKLKGPILGMGSPNMDAVLALHVLLSDEDAFNSLASEAQDARFDTAGWQNVLRFECLALLRWAFLRTKAVKGKPFQPEEQNSHFLCLLPGYGYALHILRRAVPFAYLGIRVTISTKQEAWEEAVRITNVLSNALGLAGRIQFSVANSESAVSEFSAAGRSIVLTGSALTLGNIKVAHPDAIIYAATGSCSVAISTDDATALSIESKKKQDGLSTSCSNHGATLVTSGFSDESWIYSIDGKSVESRARLGDFLRQRHPSIILAQRSEESTETLPQFISGYPVIPCEAGAGITVENFGSDPKGGWIGDYRL